MIQFYPHIKMFFQNPYMKPQPDWDEWDYFSYEDPEEREDIERVFVDQMAEENAAYRIQRLVRYHLQQRRLSVAMALHPRLGESSSMAGLEEGLIRKFV